MVKTCNCCLFLHHDYYNCQGDEDMCHEFVWQSKELELEYINSLIPNKKNCTRVTRRCRNL